MKALSKLLQFLNISDEDGISLVNLAMYVVLIKLAFAPVLTIVDIVPLLGVLIVHLGHRVLTTNTQATPQATPQVDTRVDDLVKQVNTLQGVLALKSFK